MSKMQRLIVMTASLAATAWSFESPKLLPSQPRAGFSRRGIFGECQKVFGTAACLVVTTTPTPAAAAPPRPVARFENEYTDMLHPGCDRRITVDPTPSKVGNNGKSFLVSFSGTDVGPDGIGPIVKLGCTEETIAKYKLRSWAFEGRVNAAGTDINAGDGIHVGTWHVSTKEQPWKGIHWADGNRWIVKEE